MTRFALALAALTAAATPADAAQLKLAPVEQCSSQLGFAEFRQSLGGAVERRDSRALLALVAPDVTVNFGGDSGHNAFARQWGLGESAPSPLWKELEAILKLGCARVEESALIPSLAGQFNPEADEDVFETVVVIAPAAKLRVSRGKGAVEIATLDWDVVTALDTTDDNSEVRVRLADGREGWLWRNQVRSPLDYRAVMDKRSGKWMITAFVAGD